jgi:hypothetical protein
MDIVPDPDQPRQQSAGRPAGERALEGEVFAGSRQLGEAPQHDPAGHERRRFGAERREALGDHVHVDEGVDPHGVVQEVRGGRCFPRAVWPRDHDRLRSSARAHLGIARSMASRRRFSSLPFG